MNVLLQKGFRELSYVHLKSDIDMIQPNNTSSTIICKIFISVSWEFLLNIAGCNNNHYL